MKPNSSTTEKRTLDWLLILIVLAVWTLLFFAPSPPSDSTPGPMPPDLSNCTRLEIEYRPSAYHFVTDGGRHAGLLSTAEQDHVRSFGIVGVTDLELLRAVSDQIVRARYRNIDKYGRPAGEEDARVTCYEGQQHVATLELKDRRYLVTEDGRWFYYIDTGFKLAQFLPELAPFILRCRCADTLQNLHESEMHDPQQKHGAYPEPSGWSNTIREARARMLRELGEMYGKRYTQQDPTSCLQCPSAGGGKCHYAMNPNCKPDSPEDMVLLFETKAGWNQHGGPELFTFDHHDPKGGCVLLNDGTVKFIRTKEELHALRWK